MNYRRLGWILLAVGAALFLIWAGRLLWAGAALWSDLNRLQALTGEPESLDPMVACTLVQSARARAGFIQAEAGGVLPAGRVLGWLPGVGGDLRAAPELLTVAEDLTEAGSILCEAAGPILTAWTESGVRPDLEQWPELLTQITPALQQTTAAVARAETAWAQVDATTLSPRLARKAALLEQGLPLLDAGLRLALAAPDLAGLHGPRTYLILAQNDDELRPTGGYISAVGQVTLDQGQVTTFKFMDAYAVDDYAHKPYPRPPEPLYTYMWSELWLFRDANWSPDFPTSARQAAYFYEYGQGVKVDGVVALDQYAVEMILPAFGEIHLAEDTPPLTAENIRKFMREAWNPGAEGVNAEWYEQRKAFIGQLAAALQAQLATAPGALDAKLFLQNTYRAFNERHLLVYLQEPNAAPALARLGWDGAIRATAGDYLMVVDANIGFGKVDPLIQRQISYEVTLGTDGTADATLSLTYAHQGQRPQITCTPQIPYRGHLTYESMIHRCYYDYVRIYAPAGSHWWAMTPHPTPGEYLLRGKPAAGQAENLGDEFGKAVLGQFFVVAYGQTVTTTLTYDLPTIVQAKNKQRLYTLLVQKQPGTQGTSLTLALTLPPGAKFISATPAPSQIVGERLLFAGELNTDFQVEVIYE